MERPRGGGARRLIHMFGIGHDHAPDEKRITTGPGFSILGGCKDTHDLMTTDILRFCDEAKKIGKTVEQLTPEEIEQIAERILQ